MIDCNHTRISNERQSGRVALMAATSRLIIHWDYLDPGRMNARSIEIAAQSTLSDTGNDDLSVH